MDSASEVRTSIAAQGRPDRYIPDEYSCQGQPRTAIADIRSAHTHHQFLIAAGNLPDSRALRGTTTKLSAKETTKMQMNEELRTLCNLLSLSNAAAKELTGAGRTWAYRCKCEILSTFVLKGFAIVNGKRANGTLGLTVLTDPTFRVHVPLTQLHIKARAEATRQMNSVPAMAPIGDLVRQKR
jgi:hypothetical protein